MLALYRADRQAEALEAYAEARRTLVDDLGIEPSEALQRLQQAILRHDPSLETPEGTAAVNGLVATEAAPPPTPSTAAEADESGTDAVPSAPLAARARRRRHPLQASAAAAAILSGSAGATPHIVPNSLVHIDPAQRQDRPGKLGRG